MTVCKVLCIKISLNVRCTCMGWQVIPVESGMFVHEAGEFLLAVM